MSFQFFGTPGGGGGANLNLDNSYEFIGFSSGAGTNVTAPAGTNTKGTYTQLAAGGAGGITENALRGIYIIPVLSSSAAARFLIDVSFDGGTSTAIPNVFHQPGTAVYGGSPGFYFPMAVAAGADVQVRVQSATANANCSFVIVGAISNSQSPPCFSTCTAINGASTADSLPASTNIPLTDAWTELVASTGATYGAILANAGFNGTLPAAPQILGIQVGTGAASSETAIMRWITPANTSSPAIRGAVSPLIEKTVASGTRLSAKVFAGTPGSDNIRVQLFGFS